MGLLPVFPLGTVLFPGMPLPLHVFEERYRRLVHDLLAQPEPRRFGVIAIRQGREVGADGVKALHATGCLAGVRQVAELADGRFALMTVGGQRFRLGPLDRSRPYLRAELDLLAEEAGDARAAAAAAGAVRAAFPAYLAALARHGSAPGGGWAGSGEGTVAGAATLPEDPVELSYRVASAMVIDLPDRQALLDAPDAAARLAAERALLGREIAVARSLPSAPAPGLRHARCHPN
jgi:Lon protease-like protein